MRAGEGRFRDPRVWLYSLAAEDIDVVCPRCSARAVVTTRPVEGLRVLSWPRRFVCTACVSTASWPSADPSSCWGGPEDPFFRFRLWRTAELRSGRILWAFNAAHLTLLEDFVGARLRERGPAAGHMTMIARLPAWMKAAKNRDEVSRALARMRA
ncbi:hypothetical protein [Actinoplanes philippinensis]|uniref:hypothetical protein n=1 Tax=Actinoplanes philippinensis TaxID=35752 RepID=UPI0033CF315A